MHGAPLDLNHVASDGESKAGTAGLPGAGFVDSIEAFEDALEMFGGDAGAEVADAELDRFGGFGYGPGTDDDAGMVLWPGGSVLDAVFDEIAEHLDDRVGIGEDVRWRSLTDL